MLTPDERLPYYKALWLVWASQETETPWEVIRAACLFEAVALRVGSWAEGEQLLNSEPHKWESLIGNNEGIYLEPHLPLEVLSAWQESGVTMPRRSEMRIVFRSKDTE